MLQVLHRNETLRDDAYDTAFINGHGNCDVVVKIQQCLTFFLSSIAALLETTFFQVLNVSLQQSQKSLWNLSWLCIRLCELCLKCAVSMSLY